MEYEAAQKAQGDGQGPHMRPLSSREVGAHVAPCPAAPPTTMTTPTA